MSVGTRASVRGPTRTPLPIPIPCLPSLTLANPNALQRSSPLQERPLLTPPTNIPLSTPRSSHTRATQTEQLSSEEFHPRVSLDFLSCNGPTLSNTRCMCERHGETYECFQCLHVNICMHKTSQQAFRHKTTTTVKQRTLTHKAAPLLCIHAVLQSEQGRFSLPPKP